MALKDSFSYFRSLVNIIHIRCCYSSMKCAMGVKICELIVHRYLKLELKV